MAALLPDLSARSTCLELMDDPGVDRSELERSLEELEVINRLLGGYAPSIGGIRSLLPRDARSLSILDVGCGGGDGARRIIRWARRRGLRPSIRAVDVSKIAIRYARESSRGFDEIEYEERDFFDLEGAGSFDIVHAALVLHHFAGDRAADAVRRMVDLSRRGAVVNDLHRHPVAYVSIAALTRLFSRNRLIRNDAPLSVLRSFVRRDWLEMASRAGLGPPELRRRWAFRWQAVFRKAEAS